MSTVVDISVLRVKGSEQFIHSSGLGPFQKILFRAHEILSHAHEILFHVLEILFRTLEKLFLSYKMLFRAL